MNELYNLWELCMDYTQTLLLPITTVVDNNNRIIAQQISVSLIWSADKEHSK